VAKERKDSERERGDYAQENTQRAFNAANSGANWMAEVAEHNLKQGMASLDGMLTIVRKAADGFGQQTSMIREHSAVLAEEAMRNATNFGNRMAHSTNPLEWAEAQSEFLSKQAQTVVEWNKRLAESFIHESNEVANDTLHQVRDISRKRSEAA
jgi:hypothetical protein